jgi:hypothetical protein
MLKIRLFPVCVAALSFLSLPGRAAVIVDFDELTGYTSSSEIGSYFDGYGFGASSGSWDSSGVTFNTNQFGPGWSYSNVNDPETPGFNNQFAAYSGTDASGSGNYALANSNRPIGSEGDPDSLKPAFFNLPDLHFVNFVEVTNSTYAAQSMLNGDPFTKKFGGLSGDDPDFFKVRFTGFSEWNASGSVTGFRDFYLADYRFQDNSLDYIVSSWRRVDLTSLGSARSVGIYFESTDNDPVWGMNTPAYVAIDNLGLTVVPEPSTFVCVGLIGFLSLAFRRRISLMETGLSPSS